MITLYLQQNMKNWRRQKLNFLIMARFNEIKREKVLLWVK